MSDNSSTLMETARTWNAPLAPVANKYSKRLACPFAKCYPHKFDADTPCTRRWGFDGYRLLNDHIRKYHSYRFSCQICCKGFPEASQTNLEKTKDEHCKREHTDCGDQDGWGLEHGSPAGSQGKRERRNKSIGMDQSPGRAQTSQDPDDARSSSRQHKRRRRGKPKRLKPYPERMTPGQDNAFEEWMKKCVKINSKDENVKAKYDSLCRCLFGESITPPASPYYDYLMPRYYIDHLLASHGHPNVVELEARLPFLGISEQQSSESSHDPSRSSPKRNADPYSLADEAGIEPTGWEIPQGTDSGFWSWETEARPEQPRHSTPTYIARSPEYIKADPTSTPHVLIDSTLTSEHASLCPSGVFNNQTITGIATEPLPQPAEVDDDDVDPMNTMGLPSRI